MWKFTNKVRRSIWKKRRAISLTFIIFFGLLAIFSYLTNPFTRFSIIDRNLVQISANKNEIKITEIKPIFVRSGQFYDSLGKLKSAWHIIVNRLDPRLKTNGTELNEIIKNIHKDRFSEEAAFLISGEHFSVLYPRSLGIFYNSLLDPRTALDSKDWENRQVIYLKTLALILSTYKNTNMLSTTIVPISRQSVTLINIYSPPSDTLYSILYGFKALQNTRELENIYPFNKADTEKLITNAAATKLLATYKDKLSEVTENYFELVYDQKTGLVKKNITLSGAKDSVKRSSSFYDNVIFWKTLKLSHELNIIKKNPIFLDQLKQRIIKTFWLEKEGYFLEELSDQAVKEKWYSSDWLIAYQSGFLDPDNKQDLKFLTRSVEYIQLNNIDQPFAMRYQLDSRPKQLHSTVRLFAREYGSTAIWSHWGMEYTKLLVRLSQKTGNIFYLADARDQLRAYIHNIEQYGGYPEVYENEGGIFRSRVYRGVLETGWIVNFEEALHMYTWTKLHWNDIVY